VGARTCAADRKLWQIAVPLTLFPKRDHGFSRIECIVELASPAGPGAFRVVELLPPARAEVLGKLELGGKLDLHTNAKLGMQLALAPSDLIVSDAIAELYGHGEIDRAYELRRDCVVSEIVDGTGGRWRLDDVSRPERVAPEGHQLAIVVEAAPGARPLHLTGYLQAYSDVRWLTSSLGSAWRSFRDQVAAFFHRGMPTEAYGEWRDVLPDAPW
ncbi:MAG TPA: hypothetical protein VFP84_11950, partial [Kofleriaceae bacterium]|nr:hypothetical protein [Kofleriaceae bacterium]